MNDISRRTILALGVSIPTVVLLASCAPDSSDDGVRPPTHTPHPTPAGPPAAVPSFGPNGSHYPTDLPWLATAAATELAAECDWDSIAEQVSSLTPEQVAAGAAVRVAPGTLTGAGDKSSSDAVLSALGDPAWSRNVLLCPRDGYGTVQVADGMRLDGCNRLSLFGFMGSEGSGIVLTHCADMHLGWGRWSSLNITRGGARIGLYEVVAGFRRNEDDTFGVRPTDEHAMLDISRFGCAFGPSVKPEASEAHCDTAQLEGRGTGEFGPFRSYDCVDFGSSNAAILLHTRVSLAEFHHSMILGALLPWTIFPLEAGDYRGEPNALAGGAPDVRLYNSVVCGPIGRLGYTEVVDTVLSYEPAERQRASVAGGWTVDESVGLWTADDIIARTGTDFSDESLAALWQWV